MEEFDYSHEFRVCLGRDLSSCLSEDPFASFGGLLGEDVEHYYNSGLFNTTQQSLFQILDCSMIMFNFYRPKDKNITYVDCGVFSNEGENFPELIALARNYLLTREVQKGEEKR